MIFLAIIWSHRPDVTIREIIRELLQIAAERKNK